MQQLYQDQNPFAPNPSKFRPLDRIGKWLLGLLTYFTLLSFGLLLCVILSKAVPVFFPAFFGENKYESISSPEQKEPWFNSDFFTESPSTLVTFEDEEGSVHRMGVLDYHAYLTSFPDAVIRREARHSYCGGGILGPMVGSAILVGLCFLITLALGLPSAVYLSEFATDKCLVARALRGLVSTTNPIPEITIALVGMGLFCFCFPVITSEPQPRSVFSVPLGQGLHLSFQGFGFSMIAGGFTLAILILPSMISAWEKALRSVPCGLRQASLALGTTQWQTLRNVILPQAVPGLVAVSCQGVLRTFSATVPIMWTAAIAHKNELPWQVQSPAGGHAIPAFFSQSVQAMPYHIYTITARIPQTEFVRPMQYGSVGVYVALCLLLAAIAMYFKRVAKRNNALHS